jgi:hypothetical protein
MNDSSDAHPAPAVVATFADRGEAEVVAAKLHGAGLDAFVLDGVEGGIIPVDGEAGVVVAVPAHEAETARALLVETDDETDDDVEPA